MLAAEQPAAQKRTRGRKYPRAESSEEHVNVPNERNPISSKRQRTQDPKAAFLALLEEIKVSLGDSLESISKGVKRLHALVNGKAYIRSDEVSKALEETWAACDRSTPENAKKSAIALLDDAKRFAETKIV